MCGRSLRVLEGCGIADRLREDVERQGQVCTPGGSDLPGCNSFLRLDRKKKKVEFAHTKITYSSKFISGHWNLSTMATN